ncbi:MAG: hypothetical protein WD355_09080 [Balneolaceae bacterium]
MHFQFISISLFLLLILNSCTGEESSFDSLNEQIDFLIEENRYEEALSILDDESVEDPEILLLKEKTHLNYGLHSMNTFDEGEMRTRMNEALRQFAEVLRINTENTVARQQIEQIMSIYQMMPDRGPEEDVLEDLREVGYDYE